MSKRDAAVSMCGGNGGKFKPMPIAFLSVRPKGVSRKVAVSRGLREMKRIVLLGNIVCLRARLVVGIGTSLFERWLSASRRLPVV